MSKIYCVYCGKENEQENKKCVKCKKELDPKEHLWRDYFYSHINSKFKGKVEDNLFSIAIYYIKSHLYGFAITMALIATTISGIVTFTNDHYIQKVKEKPTIIYDRKELSLEDELVNKLYQYQNQNQDLYLYAIHSEIKESVDFYANTKVTYQNLNDDAKLFIAYQNADLNETGIKIHSCEELKGYSLYHTCVQENADQYGDVSIVLPYNFYKIDTANFERMYYQIFGTDKTIPRKNSRISRTKSCEYSEEKKDYLCLQLPEGWATSLQQKTKLVKATQVGKQIELYDYHVFLEDNYENITVYKDLSLSIKLADNFTEDSFLLGQLYKHTYQMDGDGNYYWVQSEPITQLPA